MKKIKVINPLSKHSDIDNDGSPDYKDCRPFNPHLQHLRPSKTTRNRLESLPYDILDSRGHPILSKRANKQDKQMFLRMIKRHPSTLSHLESAYTKQVMFANAEVDYHQYNPDIPYGFMSVNENMIGKPKVFINKVSDRYHTNAEMEKKIESDTNKNAMLLFLKYPNRYETEKERRRLYDEGIHNLENLNKRHPYYKLSKKRKVRKQAAAQAEALHHELTHTNQYAYRRDEMFSSYYHDPYLDRWHETEARKEAARYMNKYKKNAVTQSLINSTFSIADYMDVDNDGVVDSKDCKPLDPNKQHVKLSIHVDKSITKPFQGKYNLIDLGKMLSYPRPAWSRMEDIFIRKYIDTIPKMRHDRFGNRSIRIGDSDTVFASHTDTVHNNFSYKSTEKSKPRKLQVNIKGKWATGTKKDILGADDTTGVWLMLNMIHDKKPGHYIFHRAEEIGRQGSKYIAENRPQTMKNIQRVISFDRKGYGDIITHQMGYRTASDKFAKSLAKKLGGDFKPDPTGSYTDSASYTEIVPECTNVSIGYQNAHSHDERQNLRFARHLYEQVKDINFDKLPTERIPGINEYHNPRYKEWDYSSPTESTWEYEFGVGWTKQPKQIVKEPYDDDYYSWYEKQVKKKEKYYRNKEGDKK